MDIVIRPFETDDYADWKSLYDEYNHNISDEPYARSVFAQLIDPASRCIGYAAVKDGKAIGFAHFVFHVGIKHAKQVLYLEDLAVTEAQRRQGIAKQLIDKGLELAKENGCGRFYWFTDDDNATAQKVYESYASGTKKLRYAIEIT